MRNLAAASRILAAAAASGLRESGIATVNKRIMVAVRGSIRIDVPIVEKGKLLVDDAYLLYLSEVSFDSSRNPNSQLQL